MTNKACVHSPAMATFISKSPEQTQNLGAEWGRAAKEGWLIGLIGDLGAGKTQLVKGIARGLGITQRVASPTFALVHEYQGGRLTLCHIDLYRLDTPSQIASAGLEDSIYSPQGVTVVEWIDRWFGSGVPDGWSSVDVSNRFETAPFYRHVRIALLNETQREITYEDCSR